MALANTSPQEQEAATSSCKCVMEDMENFTIATLAHFYLRVTFPPEDEIKVLFNFLSVLDYNQAIVYVNHPLRSRDLSHFVEAQGLSSTFIHEMLHPQIRLQRYLGFRKVEKKILIVTSCFGHAMQFSNVDVVINFDEAGNEFLYGHRLSSRQSRKGLVINFIRSDQSMEVLKKVENVQNVVIKPIPSVISTSSYINGLDDSNSL